MVLYCTYRSYCPLLYGKKSQPDICLFVSGCLFRDRLTEVSVSVDLVSFRDRVDYERNLNPVTAVYGTVQYVGTVLYKSTRPTDSASICKWTLRAPRPLRAGRPAAPETQAGFSVIRLAPSASAWKRIFQRRWLCPRTSASAPTFTAAAEASEFRRDCCCCTQANQKLRAQQCLRRIAISWN